MNIITTPASENGTFGVRVGFKDDNGDAIVPTSIFWKLSTEAGEVVNNRSAESVAVVSSSITIVLSGADLAIISGTDTGIRVVTVWGIFNSDLGSNLPYTGEARIIVENLIGV